MKYVDPKTCKIVDLVRDNKTVKFLYYRDREFWYQHSEGLIFPVALSEIDDPITKATLPAEEKAIFFMRWMRKYIAAAIKNQRKTLYNMITKTIPNLEISIFYEEAGNAHEWIVECLNYNITTQGNSIQEALKSFGVVIRGHMILSKERNEEPFINIVRKN